MIPEVSEIAGRLHVSEGQKSEQEGIDLLEADSPGSECRISNL